MSEAIVPSQHAAASLCSPNPAFVPSCRSTYDFRPPFKVYTTIEEDRDTTNKVLASHVVHIAFIPV